MNFTWVDSVALVLGLITFIIYVLRCRAKGTQATLVRRTRRGGMSRSDGVLGPALSPVNFYCWLRSRFGPPAGPFMQLRSNDTSNLIHWNYLLASDDGDILNVWGTNTAIEAFWF